MDILVKSLEKEISDAKNGKVVSGAFNSRRKSDKKRGEAKKAESVDEEMDDGTGIRPIEDKEDMQMEENKDYTHTHTNELEAEGQLRLGEDLPEENEDGTASKPAATLLAGNKRPQREYSDEEDDMDFEAIKQGGQQ